MPLLSVIIPVYNAQEYLGKCVESVVNQTFKDVEIILVDDCSKDNSYELCEQLARNDSRIVVYRREENGGIFAARNSGLELSKGRYVTFVDNDDWLDPEMYEKLIFELESKNLDFVSCGFKEIIGDKIVTHSHKEDGYYTKQQIRETLIYLLVGEQQISCAVWKSIFKKEIIESDNLRFLSSRVKDDFYFVVEYLLCCDTVEFISGDYYNYWIRDASTIHVLGLDNKEDSYANPIKIYEIFKRFGIINQKFYSALGMEYITSILRLIRMCDYDEFRLLVNKSNFRRHMYWRNIIKMRVGLKFYYVLVKLRLYRQAYRMYK